MTETYEGKKEENFSNGTIQHSTAQHKCSASAQHILWSTNDNLDFRCKPSVNLILFFSFEYEFNKYSHWNVHILKMIAGTAVAYAGIQSRILFMPSHKFDFHIISNVAMEWKAEITKSI